MLAIEQQGSMPSLHLHLHLHSGAAGFGSTVHVVVFQDGDAFVPNPRAAIDCGNRVAIPGAFRVTGNTPVYVCAAIDLPEQLDMTAVREQRGAALGEKTVCVTISPAQ